MLLLKRVCLNNKQKAGLSKAQHTGSISNNARKNPGPAGGHKPPEGKIEALFQILFFQILTCEFLENNHMKL